VSGSNSTSFQFIGRENDGAGLYYYRRSTTAPASRGSSVRIRSASLAVKSVQIGAYWPDQGRDTYRGFGYGGLAGLDGGLIVGVPDAGGFAGPGAWNDRRQRLTVPATPFRI
jgi:hypothetical protein